MPNWVSDVIGRAPPVMLAVGIVLGLAGLWPAAWASWAKKWSRVLIQVSIVLLGFWVSLEQVARAGVAGLVLSTGAIVFVLGVSWVLGKMLKTEAETATLLTAGTAICGGSAIAATGSAIRASSGSIAAAMAIVFLLNAAGVWAYPFIGHGLGMTDRQFGAWAAVGVHDVAGVVAAARAYSEAALADATVIKLTRVLWIVPIALLMRKMHEAHLRREGGSAAEAHHGQAKSPFPWFIVLFVGACLLRAGLDRWMEPVFIGTIADGGKMTATVLLSVALFLIGTGISREAVAKLGWRPVAHGVLLWVINSGCALACVMKWL